MEDKPQDKQEVIHEEIELNPNTREEAVLEYEGLSLKLASSVLSAEQLINICLAVRKHLVDTKSKNGNPQYTT